MLVDIIHHKLPDKLWNKIKISCSYISLFLTFPEVFDEIVKKWSIQRALAVHLCFILSDMLIHCTFVNICWHQNKAISGMPTFHPYFIAYGGSESHYLKSQWLADSCFANVCTGTREEEEENGRAAGCRRGCAGVQQKWQKGTQTENRKWNEMRGEKRKRKKGITEREL